MATEDDHDVDAALLSTYDKRESDRTTNQKAKTHTTQYFLPSTLDTFYQQIIALCPLPLPLLMNLTLNGKNEKHSQRPFIRFNFT